MSEVPKEKEMSEDEILDAFCNIDSDREDVGNKKKQSGPKQVSAAPAEVRFDSLDYGRDTEVDFSNMVPSADIARIEEAWDAISMLFAKLHADIQVLKQKEKFSISGEKINLLEDVLLRIIGQCSLFNDALDSLIS